MITYQNQKSNKNNLIICTCQTSKNILQLYAMKKIKKKLTTPIIKIDLHGLTVQGAFDYCLEELEYYSNLKHKSVEVITGKSGQIRKEFPIWLETWDYTGVAAWHGGSFTVYLS